MNNKLLTLLGFAAKAGKLSYGMNAASDAIRSGKSKLAITAYDLSAKSKKEIAFFANQYSVSLLASDKLDSQTITNAVGRKCGILSVNDGGFAEALCKAHIEGGNGHDE